LTDIREARPAEFAAEMDRPSDMRRRSDTTPKVHRGAVGIGEPRPARRHVRNEEVCRTVLVRERKRADRSNEPFVVMLLTINTTAGANTAAPWDAAINGLIAAKRETDVLGWFEHGVTVALVAPDIEGYAPSVARELEQRVRAELANRLDPVSAEKIVLDLHVHGADPDGLWTVEPLLDRTASPDPRLEL